MPLLLQRIVLGIGPAVHGDLARMHFRRLLLAAGWLYFAVHRNAAAWRQMLYFCFIICQICIRDDLDIRQARTVIQLKKTEAGFRIAPGANPAVKGRGLPNRLGSPSIFNCKLLHRFQLSPSECRNNTNRIGRIIRHWRRAGTASRD